MLWRVPQRLLHEAIEEEESTLVAMPIFAMTVVRMSISITIAWEEGMVGECQITEGCPR
jgi:hypothetical protein